MCQDLPDPRGGGNILWTRERVTAVDAPIGSYSGLVQSKSFGQLGNGGCIMSSRDDGWDLRDSDGVVSVSALPTHNHKGSVSLPRRNKDGHAWLGDPERTRHTLAATSDG